MKAPIVPVNRRQRDEIGERGMHAVGARRPDNDRSRGQQERQDVTLYASPWRATARGAAFWGSRLPKPDANPDVCRPPMSVVVRSVPRKRRPWTQRPGRRPGRNHGRRGMQGRARPGRLSRPMFWSSLPGLKRMVRPGGMRTSLPVRGFRPMPRFRGFTWNTPNPRSSMRSPRCIEMRIASNTASTASSALTLVMSCDPGHLVHDVDLDHAYTSPGNC